MFELKKISFEVMTEPIPLARPRVVRGHAYLPSRSRDYKQILQQAASYVMRNWQPLTGELFCRLNFYRKFNTSSRRFGDIDNHVKAILDALNGIVFVDDAQIISILANKHTDRSEPRIEIEISTVKGE